MNNTNIAFDNKHVDSIADRKNSAIAILLIMGTTKVDEKISVLQSLIYPSQMKNKVYKKYLNINNNVI